MTYSYAGFKDVRLPQEIERQAQGGPSFKTTILQLNSGKEKRNIEWSKVVCSYNIAYGIQYKTDMQAVQNVFFNMYGRAYAFRFRDWMDYEIGDFLNVVPQQIAVADGVATTFQIVKTYTVDAFTFTRPITKINVDEQPLKVYFNGILTSAYTFDPLTGVIAPNSLLANGVAISVLCQYDVPVRFDSDQLSIQAETFEAGSIPSLLLIEDKDA